MTSAFLSLLHAGGFLGKAIFVGGTVEKMRERAPDSRGVLVELARQVVSRGRNLIRKAGGGNAPITPDRAAEGGGDELTDTRTQMEDTDQDLRTPG